MVFMPGQARSLRQRFALPANLGYEKPGIFVDNDL